MAALEECVNEGDYEELEDDFLMLANEGQVAIEEVDEKVVIGDQAAEKKKGILKGDKFDADEAEYRDRDVVIIEASDDEEEKALQEYRLAMAALLPDAGANFTTVFGGQNDLDAGFDAFMDEEYDEDKMGEL